jgi:phosphate transport system substrate-binding protein
MHFTHRLRRGIRTALLGLAASALATVTCAAIIVNGSGSTFVHPVMLKWAASYNAKTNVQVSYQSIGSGAGIRQIKEKAVAFGASDKPLPPDELQAAGLAQFPLVIGGVVPVVNVDGITSGQLNFTGELLADIFLGKVTTWNDPAIVALNPEAKLPALKISVAYRSDGSGTTFNWVNYLSKLSPEWKAKVGEGTTVKWPTGTGGNGNEGVARAVGFIKGSIGYVELAYAVQHKMVFAKVRNKSGVFVTPTPESFQAAAANASWKAPDFYEVLTDAAGKDSWPITATVFVLMPKSAPDPTKSAEALRFFRWALEQGQADAKSLDYVPLPEGLVKQIEAYWAQSIK